MEDDAPNDEFGSVSGKVLMASHAMLLFCNIGLSSGQQHLSFGKINDLASETGSDRDES